MKTHRESPYMGLMPPASLSGDHARARSAASTSASTLSCASRWRCQQHQRHVYISARAARERKSAPQEPRHASAPWHASVVLLPATPPALPRAVAAHSSALRPSAACCRRTFYAPPPGLSRTAPCWPGPPRATQTSSARCCAQGPRAHASPAEARRAVRPTFVGSLRYCTRPLCPQAGDAAPGLQRKGKSYGQISATFARENGMTFRSYFGVNCHLHESPKTSPRSLIRSQLTPSH